MNEPSYPVVVPLGPSMSGRTRPFSEEYRRIEAWLG